MESVEIDGDGPFLGPEPEIGVLELAVVVDVGEDVRDPFYASSTDGAKVIGGNLLLRILCR